MTTDTAVLDCKLPDNDADAETVRDYLKALLRRLWYEGENFSGKRPLGNSDWVHVLVTTLINQGVASNYTEADDLIYRAIEAL